MVRIEIGHTKGQRIYIKVYRKGKKTKIIEYIHNLGKVSKRIYKLKSYDSSNYITKDHKERVKKNKEELAKFEKEFKERAWQIRR